MLASKRFRDVMQTACAVAVMATLFVLARYGSSSQFSGLFTTSLGGDAAAADSAQQDFLTPGQASAPAVASEGELAWSLPACRELRQALDELVTARKELLKASLEQGSDTVIEARQRYQSAAQATRKSMLHLQQHVDPEQFELTLQDLTSIYQVGYDSEGPIWELDELSRIEMEDLP